MHPLNNDSTKQCILILGMHRSGTSAAAGCLNILGFEIGQHIVPPGEPNEKGYFENDSINHFNEEILHLLFARWHDTLSLPDEWWLDERLKEKNKELEDLLQSEFNFSSNFIIKDPRNSVLLPLYLNVFNKLNITPKFIINFRNPYEVAASLQKRDNLSFSKSLLLWMDTNLKAEFYSRPYSRLFLNYNSLLTEPIKTLKKVIERLKLNIEITDKEKLELGQFIEAKLKHHSFKDTIVDQEIPDSVYQITELLNKLDLKDITKQQQKSFDNIHKLFYSEFRFFNGVDKSLKIRLKTIDTNLIRNDYSTNGSSELNLIQFVINTPTPISEYWIYPANQRVALQLSKLQSTLENGEILVNNIEETNAEKMLDNGLLIFESEVPWIKIKLDKPSIVTQIHFELQFIAFSGFTYRTSIKERDILEINLSSKLKKQKKEKEDLELKNVETIKPLHLKIKKLEEEKTSIIDLESKIEILKKEKSELIKNYAVQGQNYEENIVKLEQKINSMIALNKKVSNDFVLNEKKITTELQFNNKQLKTLMGSRSWIIGRFITWPYRKLKERL